MTLALMVLFQIPCSTGADGNQTVSLQIESES